MDEVKFVEERNEKYLRMKNETIPNQFESAKYYPHHPLFSCHFMHLYDWVI